MYLVLGEASGPGAPWVHVNRTGSPSTRYMPQPDGLELRVEGTREQVADWMSDHAFDR